MASNASFNLRPDQATSVEINSWDMQAHERGSIVWNTDISRNVFWDGSGWVALGGTRYVVEVSSKTDLPTAIGSVITLLDDLTYLFSTDIDLMGDRLVLGSDTTVTGTSSENASITSTGLGVGVALITSVWTNPIKFITFKDVDTALDYDGFGNAVALDWNGVNFLNVPNIGTIKDVDNFIFLNGAFLNSKGMLFDGTISTIAFSGSSLIGDGLAGDLIKVLSTCIITKRFRSTYSSVVASALTTGINVDASATIPDEAFILDTIIFSGGGTYLAGLDETSNKSLFIKCKPIINTFVNGQLYMQGNATITPIAVAGTFYKVLGTTTASDENSKFLHTNNRLTCDAIISRKYLIQCALNFSSGNNKECNFGFYDSSLASVRLPSRTKSTSNASGKAENVSFNCVVNCVAGDYFEIWCANVTDTTGITVTDMNFVITEIGN